MKVYNIHYVHDYAHLHYNTIHIMYQNCTLIMTVDFICYDAFNMGFIFVNVDRNTLIQYNNIYYANSP